MKKLLLSCMIVGVAISASAQSNVIKFGIKAGATFPNISSTNTEEVDMKPNTSFYVGGTVDFPVSDIFSIQSGLTFSGKGAKGTTKMQEQGLNVDVKLKTRLWYLEIPVNAMVHLPAGDGQVFLGAGPYYGYAISGKNKGDGVITQDGTTTTVSVAEDVDFNDGGEFKRSDFGLNFLAGYQLNSGLNIHAGYGLGLAGIAQDSSLKPKNRVISVGLGFTF